VYKQTNKETNTLTNMSTPRARIQYTQHSNSDKPVGELARTLKV